MTGQTTTKKAKIRIGFLPLYLELYDQTQPEIRPRVDQYLASVKSKLDELPIEWISAPVCRVQAEFAAAVDQFIAADVSAVVTLHLAYSPSLESIDALERLGRPVIMLDTTEKDGFAADTSPDEIMFNHGIHGVQDLANLLRRRDLTYFVEAGHFLTSDVISRVARLCEVAAAAHQMRRARVGIVGQPFPGMGDFAIPFGELHQTLGMTVIPWTDDQYPICRASFDDAEMVAEMDRDRHEFDLIHVQDASHRRSTEAGLVLRSWIASQQLDALSVNFQAIDRDSPFACMPFLEISKSMRRGLGYAGEGDALTAAFGAALAALTDQVSFTEMFCPDWMGETVFLSHMGEINPEIALGRPRLVEMDFPYTTAENPLVAYALYRPGQATLVNVAPLGNGRYALILCPGEICSVTQPDQLADSVHGWFKPQLPLAEFLQRYSQAGGTHHLNLIYETDLDQLVTLGRLLDFQIQIIQ